jgi:hypothetical protein
MLERAKPARVAIVMQHARQYGYTKRTPTIGMRVCAIVEDEADRLNESTHSLVRRAGIHHGVFARWRTGVADPTLRTIEKLESIGIRIL